MVWRSFGTMGNLISPGEWQLSAIVWAFFSQLAVISSDDKGSGVTLVGKVVS